MKKITFITKNYPPAVWGMQNYCRDLVAYFRKSGVHVDLIANGKWSKRLPVFGIRALFGWLRHSMRSDAIWIWDASISFFGFLFGKLTGKPRYVTVHALDITRPNKIYQKIIPKLVAQADRVVAVSEYTKRECMARWIPEEIITVIPNGIDPEHILEVDILKHQLLAKYNLPSDKKILFSIWRHIERKWFHRFISEIIPLLSQEYIYILASSGKWTEKYRQIIKEKWIENSVYLIWRIDDDEKFARYAHADRFIMPNIEVPGDAEWFGIVCIEAWRYGCPVIASDREGISDAVIHDETWYLIQWYDLSRWANEVDDVYLERNDIHEKVKEKYSWNNLIANYLTLLWYE